MIVSQIAAASENNAIGRQGDLPWHIPEDLKFFRKTTNNHIIIMGRKTYESCGLLPYRLNIIVTRDQNLKVDGGEVVNSIDEALELAKKNTDSWGDEVFVCGGGEIYKQAMPRTDKIYLTRIHMEISDGDAFFPEIDLEKFKETDSRFVEGEPSYTFLVYNRL